MKSVTTFFSNLILYSNYYLEIPSNYSEGSSFTEIWHLFLIYAMWLTCIFQYIF